MNETKNTEMRLRYLSQFKAKNSVNDAFGADIQKIGTKLVDVMKKEDLTREQAYASLQYAYNLIQYEANFLKLK